MIRPIFKRCLQPTTTHQQHDTNEDSLIVVRVLKCTGSILCALNFFNCFLHWGAFRKYIKPYMNLIVKTHCPVARERRVPLCQRFAEIKLNMQETFCSEILLVSAFHIFTFVHEVDKTLIKGKVKLMITS